MPCRYPGAGQGETPQSLVTPAFAGFPPIAESGIKAALTTGLTTDRNIFDFPSRRDIMAAIEYPGIAKLVSRLVWENTTSRIKNSITGCSAVGSAPALGAGCRRFESCHSDHLSQKNRLKRRFFCVKSLFFSFTRPHSNCGQRGKMAVLVTVQKNAEISKIPNPSLTGVFSAFCA